MTSPNINLWKHNNIIIETDSVNSQGDSFYNLKIKILSAPVYSSITNLPIYEESRYKPTVLVKKEKKKVFLD